MVGVVQATTFHKPYILSDTDVTQHLIPYHDDLGPINRMVVSNL